jgi:hypothetical protein
MRAASQPQKEKGENKMSYFISTYTVQVTRKQAKEINRRISQIDPKAAFVRHYAAGNHVHGWIERPNDGTNDCNFRRETNMQMKQIADKILLGR